MWANQANSNYNALQLSLKKQVSHGMAFNVNYTWSHAIDDGSTWHSGSTSSNGAGGGDGYTTDVLLPGLDRGNSIFDIRHRLVANYIFELPFYKSQEGILGHILGGWQYNGIVSWQTGAHWEPWTFTNGGDPVDSIGVFTGPNTFVAGCSQAQIDSKVCVNAGGDYNLDGIRNDRPNASASHFTPEPRSVGERLGFGLPVSSEHRRREQLEQREWFVQRALPGLQRKHGTKQLRGSELHILGNVPVQEHPDHGASENGIPCGGIQRAQPHQLPTSRSGWRNQ